MKRLIIPSLLAFALILSACGPGLLLGAGGAVGVILGLDSGDEKKKDTTPPPPTTNVTPAVVVTSVTREDSPCSINYTIIDANLDQCTVEVEYDAGSGFSACTEGTGGDGITNLASSAGGIAHVFSWDYLTDEGPGANASVSVRIRADDGQGFGSWFTLGSQSIGNDAPTITNVVTTGSGNVVLVTFDFSDVNSDVGFINTAYSIDQGANFIDVAPAEFVGNPPSSIASSPGGSPGQFIWNSLIVLPDYVGEVLLRLVPADMPSGFAGVTLGAPLVIGPATVDNSVNGPPEVGYVTVLDAATFTGEVKVDFDLLDDESDASLLAVAYSEDGTNWFDATLRSQISAGVVGPFFTTPAPSLYSFTWDALANVGDSAVHTVKLRIAGHDGQTGTFIESDWFTVIGNEAPQVSAIEVFQNSGNITVNFDVWDENFDPVSLDIRYSTDGGTIFSTVPSSHWILGDPTDVDSSPVGEGNILIWDTVSTLLINNFAGVILRAIPTDTPSSAPSATLVGGAFDSVPFPVVNDAAGADPISIDVYTTAANSLTQDTVNRLTVPLSGSIGLGAVVNPSSATVKNTYWGINETGADYGSMSPNTGSAGTITKAQGSFDVTAFGSIVDGDTFTIDDGIQGPQIFEFDSNTAVLAGNTAILVPFSSNDQAAADIAAAINSHSLVGISAVVSTNTINLTHFIGCRVGNTGAIPGNAGDLTFSNGTPYANVNQMGTTTVGISDEYVTYTAPSVAPVGSDHVTIFCAIDHPNFQFTVTQIYEIYFGDAPTAVNVTPSTSSVLINEQQQLTVAVVPAGAPQVVWWEVEGGAVNGTTDQTGLYSAPSAMPTTNPVAIKVYSIDDTVVGTAWITLIPEPTSVVVTSTSSITSIDVGNQTEQFTAVVNPGTAPQTVTWRIFWNGNNMGVGDLSTVGTVSNTGLYTSPNTKPVPDDVFIEAVSTVRPAVFGNQMIRLIALVPTSFTLTPTTATVIAGGAGQQFAVGNFLPTGANEAVVWSISPQVGVVDQLGFYTPPAIAANQTTLTVKATSAVSSTVFQESSITVNPASGAPPTGIVLTPTSAFTFAAGEQVQFTHVVSPGGASQSVNWNVLTGVGSIDSTGLYTPSATIVDDEVTIRCDSTINGVFATATIKVDGSGSQTQVTTHEAIAKTDHSALLNYDTNNAIEEIWHVGGKSAISGNDFDLSMIVYDATADEWHPATEIGNQTITLQVQNISACIDDNGIISAVVGYATQQSEVWTYDVNNGFTGSWTLASSSGPNLLESHSYTLFAYPCAGPGSGTVLTPTHLMLLTKHNEVHPFDIGSNSWGSPANPGASGQATKVPHLCGHTYAKDASDPALFFAGINNNTGATHNGVWQIDLTDKSPLPPELFWTKFGSSGEPSAALVNPSLTWDYATEKLILFGGRDYNTTNYKRDFWEMQLVFGAGTATWNKKVPSFLDTPATGPEISYPQARVHGAIVLNVARDFVHMFGGSIGTGKYGDAWTFDYPGNYVPDTNNENTFLKPQGREDASGAIDDNGKMYFYGGKCDFGVSNELWALENYDATNGTGEWVRKSCFANAIGDMPPPLWGASLEYNQNIQKLYLIGGAVDKNKTIFNNDVYALDTSSFEWTKLSPTGGPSGRIGQASIFDVTSDRIYIFGGEDGSGPQNDFYYFETATVSWTAMTGSTPPTKRLGATLGYDVGLNEFYLLGGDDGTGSAQQLYVWKSNVWSLSPVLNNTNAEDVWRSGGAWDSEHQRFFHAPTGKATYQSVTTTYNGPSWHYLIGAASNNTTGSTGLYDPNNGFYIAVFGSKNVSGNNVGTNITRSFMVK